MLRKLLDLALATVIAAGSAAAVVYWWAVQPI